MNVSIIGLDIAKNVFQVHGEDAEGEVVVQKRLGRKRMIGFFSKLPPCVVASRLVGPPIIGAVRCGLWGMRSG
jgi:transposase